ncbi:MAG: four helix bundle protein [Tepidiformaceae bacterium]
MRPFRDFRVWQDSHELTLRIYKVTRLFPRDERYALTNQMWRAAYSIPMNIAEGSAKGDREFHQALRIALGSATELEYQLLLAKDLGYLPLAEYSEVDARVLSVKRQLVSFMQKVQAPVSEANGQRPTANGPADGRRPTAGGTP